MQFWIELGAFSSSCRSCVVVGGGVVVVESCGLLHRCAKPGGIHTSASLYLGVKEASPTTHEVGIQKVTRGVLGLFQPGRSCADEE
eukprot:2583328-Amphidinium_carterae.1